MVAQHEDRLLGIMVDSVSQVLRVNRHSIQPPPPGIGGIELKFIEGITRYNGRLIIILNVEELFNIDLFKRE